MAKPKQEDQSGPPLYAFLLGGRRPFLLGSRRPFSEKFKGHTLWNTGVLKQLCAHRLRKPSLCIWPQKRIREPLFWIPEILAHGYVMAPGCHGQ